MAVALLTELDLPTLALETALEPVDRLMDELWRRGPAILSEAADIPADVYETADEVVVRMDIPGVKPEDVQVRFLQDRLEVRALRRAPEEQPGTAWYLRQLPAGEYWRSLRVGVPIDAGAVTATTRDGVLEVHLPKAESAKPRVVPVQVVAPAAAGASARD